ncbi:MAG: Cna B-type domain-containing protein, partial [Ruminococcus sp.]|nr:Cna B-type domain-containing protein [Ruminococcus sp.]
TYQYIYYVKEETTSNKWKVSYQHNGQPANGQMAITVTNTGDEEVKKLPIKVEKKWKVDNIDVTNDATKHPDEVTVQLYSASSENGTFSPVAGTTFTLNKENNWEHIWENVCEEGLYYKVVETKINGWNANSDIKQITTDSTVENPVTITLTNTPEVGDLQIEKSWMGEANADSVQVELYRVAVDENGTPISNATEQTDNVARAYNFNSESGLLSLSRVKRAVAELETQSSEQETPQAEAEKTTETTKSSGSLGKMKSTVSAKATGNSYVSLPINMNEFTTKTFDMPVSELSGKTITSVKAVFEPECTNVNVYFDFCTETAWDSGHKDYTVYNLSNCDFDVSCANYKKV